MEKYFYSKFSTVLGNMVIASDSRGITRLSIIKSPNPPWLSTGWIKDKDRFSEEVKAIRTYLNGTPTALEHLSGKLSLKGTVFQKQVWRKLLHIPPGSTSTYSAIAEEIQRPGAARAVGSACNANPIILLIPCHRVIGEAKISGYAWGTDMKLWLLNLEKKLL